MTRIKVNMNVALNMKDNNDVNKDDGDNDEVCGGVSVLSTESHVDDEEEENEEFCVTSCEVETHAKCGWLAVPLTLSARVPHSECDE